MCLLPWNRAAVLGSIVLRDSDYDVWFVYARLVDEYLRLKETRDTMNWRLDETLDIVGWLCRSS